MERQTELRQADRAVRVLAEHVPLGICDLDASGQLRWVNGEVLRLLGHDSDVGTEALTWERLIHPDDLRRIRAALAECRVTGRELRLRHRILRPDNELRWVQLDATPIFDDDGAVERIVASLNDLTALAQMSSEIQAARDAAMEAVRAKSDFLAHINHEIRTPLNGVLGMTDILLDSTLPSEQLRYVDILRSAGQQLLALLNESLDLPAVGAGRMAVERVPFDLQQLVNDVLQVHAEHARRKHVGFSVAHDGPLPPQVDGDPQRIRQMLDRVIGSAVASTEHGAVEVAVSAEILGEASAILRFTVRKPHSGSSDPVAVELPAVDATDPSSDDPVQALSVSKQDAQLMGGDLVVDSIDGHGTLCRFWLPVTLTTASAVNAAPEAQSRVRSSNSRPRPRPGASNRVLLVEDNPINQAVALAMLERLGYPADTVHDCNEALETVAERNYAVILMDCQMPRMDGYEATRRIRKTEPPDVRTPIVALTASAFRGDREKCLAAGMDDYLSKPISIDALRDILDLWLDRDDASPVLLQPDDRPDPPVLDLQTVGELAEIPQLLQRATQRFTAAGSEQLDEIRRAVGTADLAQVKAAAHSLKGAAGTVGAVALAAALEGFERACDATPDQLEVLLDELDAHFADACAALTAAVTSPPAQTSAVSADLSR